MKTITKRVHPLLSIPYSIYAWFSVIFFTVLFSLIGVLLVFPVYLVLNRGTRSVMHQTSILWAKAIMYTSPVWSFRVTGAQNIDPGKHYVIVANHQSLLDILLVLAALKLHFKFMAKQELFCIPFIGWHMAAAGYIPLVRSSRVSGKDALTHARDWLSREVSVLFFPEGTRSLNGEIKDFKAGAFKTAKEMGVEILPVILDGTGAAVPKKSWKLNKITEFRVKIGKPSKVKSVGEAKKNVRDQMAADLALLRKP